MARKRLTTLQSQVKKEMRRIQAAAKRLEGQGFILPDNIYGRTLTRPTRKYLAELKKITPEILRYRSLWYHPGNGEVYKGGQGERIRRELNRTGEDISDRFTPANPNEYNGGMASPTTPDENRFWTREDERLYDLFMNELQHLPSPVALRLYEFLKNFEKKFGRDDLIQMMKEATEAGAVPTARQLISGDENEVYDAVSKFFYFLPEATAGWIREVMDDWQDTTIQY